MLKFIFPVFVLVLSACTSKNLQPGEDSAPRDPAAASNCFGVQQNKGAQGLLNQTNKYTLVFNYTTKDAQKRRCVLQFDEDYRPRTSDPKSDRYLPVAKGTNNCAIEYAWVNKSLTVTGKGFVDVVFPCGGGGGCAHGETGEIESFTCNLN